MLSLFVLNGWIAWRMLRIEWFPYFHSVEGSLIGLQRYIAAHWGDLSWFPLWYSGMPFPDTYVPALQVLSAIVATVAKLSAPRAYHVVCAVAYAVAPVAAYVMMRQLGASRWASWLGAAGWSLFSASAFLMPDVGKDLSNPLYIRRLHVMVMWGEGAHIASMGLQCLVIAALERTLATRSARWFAMSAILMGVTAATNIPGSLGLLVSGWAWIAAHARKEIRPAARIAAGAAVFGYLLIAFAVPPSTVATIVRNSPVMHDGFVLLGRSGAGLVCLAIAAPAGGLLAERLGWSVAARFTFIEAVLMAVVAISAESGVFEMLPQAGRLHVEMDRSIALLAGVVFARRGVLIAVTVAALLFQMPNAKKGFREVLRAGEIEGRSEYVSARWLATNAPGERTYATGSTAFWLNAFADIPQVTGCCEQGRPNPFIQHLLYLVNVGKDDEVQLAADWLTVYGASTLIVAGPGSNDAFRDVADAGKFAAVMPLKATVAGNLIYSIQGDHYTLAHRLRAGEYFRDTPKALYRTPEFDRLVAAIRDPGRNLDFAWQSGTQATVRGHLEPGDMVWVQVSAMPGWKAVVNGAERPVKADGITYLLVDPRCSGDCEIALRFAGTPYLGWWQLVSAVSACLAAYLLVNRRGFRGPAVHRGPSAA